jgi:nucleotidyltransferase/DNA polymerase involved in DNA repair
MPKDTWILHIDGDGFFAYCEISRFPHLKGKAVVVGEDRGIACAMTYEAKKLGITRAMPTFKIREQFPEVVILSSHFELYEQYAQKLASIVEGEVDVLERYSIDECFARIRLPSDWSEEELEMWLKALKNRVQSQLGITYSFGMARTKVLAKIASKRGKPDGCTVIMPHRETSVLQETSIESIWGIGWKLSRRFQNMKVRTAFQFASWNEERVRETFSLPVQELWHELHGRMMFPVSNEHTIPKSLQATKSFTPSSSVHDFVLAELLQNTDIAFSRMRKQQLTTKSISIFLKTTERKYHSMNISLPYYTNNPLGIADIIKRCVHTLFKKGVKYKSTGITLWALRLQSDINGDLFGMQQEITEDNTIMDAVDAIRKRYGHMSIGLLASMPSTLDRTTKSRMRMEKESFVHGLPLPYLGEVN